MEGWVRVCEMSWSHEAGLLRMVSISALLGEDGNRLTGLRTQ